MAKRELPPPSPSPSPPPAQSQSPQEDSPSSDEDSVEQVVANGSPAGTNSVSGSGSGGGDAAESTTSYVYLRSLIQELIEKHRFVGWDTVDDLISQIGDSSMVRKFEAEAKALKVEEFKLLARERNLRAEVLGFLAKAMSDDDK